MSWVAAAVVGGAVIGGVASSRAASKQSSATQAAAATQSDATLQSAEMQLDFLRETRSDIADAVAAGEIDLNAGFNLAIQQLQPYTGTGEYNTARNLLQDPSAIMDRPSTQFQYDQGIEALQAAFSRTSGGGLSGQGVRAAQQFGQNLASTALDAELNRLFPFINSSIQARGNIANFEASRGSALANLRLGGAAGSAQVSGQFVPGIAAGVQQQGNIAANALIQGANVQTGLYSNLANIGTGALNSLATQPQLFSTTPAATPAWQSPQIWDPKM